MNEGIIGGLKNALERGYSLEEAVQSFINAGYNPNEVRQAAQSISEGAISITTGDSISLKKSKIEAAEPQQYTPQYAEQQPKQQISPQIRHQMPDINYQKAYAPKKRGKNTLIIIFLVIILLLLIGSLVYFILFGEEFLSSILGSE